MESTFESDLNNQTGNNNNYSELELKKQNNILKVLVLVLSLLVLLASTVILQTKQDIKEIRTNIDKKAVDSADVNTPTKIPETESSPINNNEIWKIYKNNDLGFSISYPNNWFELGENPDKSINFANKNVGAPLEMGGNGFWITISREENDGILETLFQCKNTEICSKNITMAQDGGKMIEGITKVADLKIDNLPSVKYTVWASPVNSIESDNHFFDNLTFVIKKDNTYYKISSLSSDKNAGKLNADTFDKIVKSFRLID